MSPEILDFIKSVGFPAAAWFITFAAMNKHYTQIIDKVSAHLEASTKSNIELKSVILEMLHNVRNESNSEDTGK